MPLITAAFILLTSSAGCNSVACFRASEAGGTCPAREAALPFFGDPLCRGTVKSVDSDATLVQGTEEEGNLCCYTVTPQSPDTSGCPI